jgi:hypothetical protein
MAIVLAVWALWILDPMSRLGDRFYLGPVFRYAGPGFWFGLPTGSQVGFAATAAILLGTLFWLARDEPDRAVDGGLVRHPHAIALLTYHAQVFHLAVVAWWIGADTIGGAAVLMWVPVAAMTAVYWGAQSRSASSSATGSGALLLAEPADSSPDERRRTPSPTGVG